MKNWFLVPVRGGSKGVPRKNIKLLGEKPLLAYSLETLLQVAPKEQIIVISDDEEILDYADSFSVRTLIEEKTTGKATLDDVAMKVLKMCPEIQNEDLFFTIQATCPFVKKETILNAISYLKGDFASVITAIDDRHLSWGLDKNNLPIPHYKERLNRQDLPAHFKESGAVIASTVGLIKQNQTRINHPIKLLPITKNEGVDIDDFCDWAVAEYIANRKIIAIRTDAAPHLGMGHVYRSLAVAQELSKHDITIYVSKDYPLGEKFFANYPIRFEVVKDEADFLKKITEKKPVVTIIDRLNTEKEYIQQIKKVSNKVITFEDQGTGAHEADLLISDLYKNVSVEDAKQLSGVTNAIIAPSFETLKTPISIKEKVEKILILFGGTDPSNLTELALKSLSGLNFKGEVTVIQGLGRNDRIINLDEYNLNGKVLTNVSYMPKEMRKCDIAISSAGRTITELMTFGIPTLCICQNEKEISHTHASQQYGVMNLGLGKLLVKEVVQSHLDFLINSYELRKSMSQRALFESKDRKNSSIIKRMMNILELEI